MRKLFHHSLKKPIILKKVFWVNFSSISSYSLTKITCWILLFFFSIWFSLTFVENFEDSKGRARNSPVSFLLFPPKPETKYSKVGQLLNTLPMCLYFYTEIRTSHKCFPDNSAISQKILRTCSSTSSFVRPSPPLKQFVPKILVCFYIEKIIKTQFYFINYPF